MTNEQLIAKFNPANSKNLTPEDFEIMRALTDAQLDVLAEAYPNTPSRRSYLRLYDTKLEANKQIYNLSTWQNLRNVRKFSNMKNLVPYDFFNPSMKIEKPAQGITSPAKQSAKKQVIDLSATEAAAELAKSMAKQPAEKTAKPSAKKGSAAAEAKAKKAAETVEQTSQADAEEFPDVL